MIAERPITVAIVTAVVAINGIASLVTAIIGIDTTLIGLLGAFLSAVIGLALLHRAYGLWHMRHRAWQIALVLLAPRTMLAFLYVRFDPYSAVVGVDLILAVVTIMLLTRPRVKEAFADREPEA